MVLGVCGPGVCCIFFVIGDLIWVSLVVGFLGCCIWVFVVLGFLWWLPCSSQKVTRFLILSLILLLPFVSLFFFSGVSVSWCCGFLSSYWVFVLGFLLGFSFWVGGVCHFRWPCRYLPTRSEMLVIMVFSVLAFFLSGRCGLISLLGDRSRECWGRSRFCGLSRLVWRDWLCCVSLLGDRSRACWRRSRFCGLSRLVWRDWLCGVSLLGDRSRACWGRSRF